MDKSIMGLLPFFAFAAMNVLRDKDDETGSKSGDDTDQNGDKGDDKSGDKGDDETDAERQAREAKEADEAERQAREDADKAKKKADKTGDSADKKEAEEKADLLKEVMDKKQKLRDTEKEKADLEAKLKAYGDIDPDKAKELVRKEQEAQQAALEAKGEFERVKEMMREQSEKESEELRAELEREREANKSKDAIIDDLTVGNAFSSSKFIQENLVISSNKARQLYAGHFEMVDGQLVGFDKPAGAKDRTQLVNGSGDPVSFDEAMKRIIEADPDKNDLTRSNARPGGGSKTNSGGEKKPGADKKKSDGLYGRTRIANALKEDT
jgi:hypothetical protein